MTKVPSIAQAIQTLLSTLSESERKEVMEQIEPPMLPHEIRRSKFQQRRQWKREVKQAEHVVLPPLEPPPPKVLEPITIHEPNFRIPSCRPQSAHQLEIWTIAQKAAKNKWIVHPIVVQNNHWVWKLVDGHNKEFNVELYRDGQETRIACDCDEYCSLVFNCQHQQVISFIVKGLPGPFTAAKHLWDARPVLPKIFPVKLLHWNFLLNVPVETGKLQSSLTHETCSYKRRDVMAAKALPAYEPIQTDGLVSLPLFDYQKEALQVMAGAGRALCAMPIGSGKTLVSLAALNHIQKMAGKQKIVIIATKTLLAQWDAAIRAETKLDPIFLSAKNLDDFTNGPPAIGLITYQLYQRHHEKIGNVDLTILDEIQFIRNSDTKIWKAVSKMNTKYFYGLTGTAIENRLDDLYAIMDVIEPGLLGPKWHFQDTYQDVVTIGNNKIIFGGAKNINELKERIKHRLYAVDVEVAPVQIDWVTQHTPMLDAQRSLHNTNWDAAKTLIAQNLNSAEVSHKSMVMVQAYLLKARQASSDLKLLNKNNEQDPCPKTKSILSRIQALVAAGNQVVCYSEWVEYIEWLCKHSDGKFTYSFLHGQLSILQRKAAIDDFVSGKAQVFFSSDAGGIGIDGLQKVSNHIIHCEVPYNPARLDQRTGRLNRLGQTKQVTSEIFLGEDSIETHIFDALQKKLAIRDTVLYGG